MKEGLRKKGELMMMGFVEVGGGVGRRLRRREVVICGLSDEEDGGQRSSSRRDFLRVLGVAAFSVFVPSVSAREVGNIPASGLLFKVRITYICPAFLSTIAFSFLLSDCTLALRGHEDLS